MEELDIGAHRRKGKGWEAFWWIIFVLCLAIFAFQVPKIISAFQQERPIRQGPYATDDLTDRCIHNLWIISWRLQEGRIPNTHMVCPASKKPYVIRHLRGDLVVSCPNPELHGAKELRVSRKHPVPELVRKGRVGKPGSNSGPASESIRSKRRYHNG